ncbi:glycosyltransferase family 4 protein, partial [Streptomyces sp. NPDC059637]|uniref:glycosyltransferase family 4 protein n=1 Tax=Streptomyces sp. NPDC059637 TaxID=3347752 RepID=UPI00369B3595
APPGPGGAPAAAPTSPPGAAAPPGTAPAAGVRVAVLTAGSAESAARAHRVARTAAGAGYDVHLLVRASTGPAGRPGSADSAGPLRVPSGAEGADGAGGAGTVGEGSPEGSPGGTRPGGAGPPGGPRTVPVTVGGTLARNRLRRPRPGLRRPLAYRSEDAWRYRLARLAARRALLRTRAAELSMRHRPAPFALIALAVARLAHVVGRLWTRMRAAQYRSATALRASPDSFADDVATAVVRAVSGKHRAWQRLAPGLLDLETAYGPVLDALRPQLIHAHGQRMLGVAVRAALRAEAAGHRTVVVWDAAEHLPGTRFPSRRTATAYDAHERVYAPRADAVVTVSEACADLLARRHRLPERPAVVVDAPSLSPLSPPAAQPVRPAPPPVRPAAQPVRPAPRGGVRSCCGLAGDVPLLVHSGPVSEERGLLTVVEALPKLYDLHAAFVVPDPGAPYVRRLLDRAADAGVAGRLHVLGHVPHEQVPAFLATADIGVAPVHPLPHHQVALPARYFDYAHARLPVVVSDVRPMAAATLALGNGEVFRARNTADFVRAVGAVLTNPQRYRRAYERPGALDQWSWEAASAPLPALWARLLGPQPR